LYVLIKINSTVLW